MAQYEPMQCSGCQNKTKQKPVETWAILQEIWNLKH